MNTMPNLTIGADVREHLLASARPFEWFHFHNLLRTNPALRSKNGIRFWHTYPLVKDDHMVLMAALISVRPTAFGFAVSVEKAKETRNLLKKRNPAIQWGTYNDNYSKN